MANRFDKPYRTLINIDYQKIIELFELINQLDTQQIIQYSLNYNIPLNVQLQNGNNLIHQVLINNDKTKNEINKLNVIKFLVHHEVNPDEPNKENQTPIHIACHQQYELISIYLIKECKVDLNYKDNNGLTALHYLLCGKINLYEKKENTDLISFEGKGNIDKKNKILEIKKQIYTMIKNEPFLKSLENTIYDTLINSPYINNKIIEMEENVKNIQQNIKNIQQNIKDTDHTNILLELEENINKEIISTDLSDQLKKNKEIVTIYKDAIKKIIKELWGDFKDTDKLKLHIPTIDSYKINPTDKIGIITNINIKKILKTDINKTVDNIITNFETYFNGYHILDTIEVELVLQYIYIELFNDTNQLIPPNQLIPLNQTYYNIVNGRITYNRNNIFEDQSDFIDILNYIQNDHKHTDANDFADNIINLKTKEFIGGSRNLSLNIQFKNNYTNIQPLRELFNTELNYKLKFKKLFAFVILDDYNELYNNIISRVDLINIINNITNTDIDSIEQVYNNNNDKPITNYIKNYINVLDNYKYTTTIYYEYTKLLCYINPNVYTNLEGYYDILVMNFMSCLMNNQYTFENFIANLTFYLMIDSYDNINNNNDKIKFLQDTFLKFIDPLEDDRNISYTNDILNKITDIKYKNIINNILLSINEKCNTNNVNNHHKYIKEITEKLYILFNFGYIKVSEIMLCDFIYIISNISNYELFKDIIYEKNIHNNNFSFNNFIDLFLKQDICIELNNLSSDNNLQILYKILLSNIPPSFQYCIYMYIQTFDELKNNINDPNNDNIKNYYFNKFKESVHLKLHYVGTLANFDINSINIGNNRVFEFEYDQYDNNINKISSLPLPFNYVYNYLNQINIPINKYGNASNNFYRNYFIYQENQYRPPTIITYYNILINIYNKITNIILNIIYFDEHASFMSFFSSIKTGKLLDISKYYLCLYQIINILIKKQDFIHTLLKIENANRNTLGIANRNNIDNIKTLDIKQLVNFFNELNGYIFLYYYLNSTSNELKIPKFSYYRVDADNFYYLDSTNELELPYEEIVNYPSNTFTKSKIIRDSNNVQINYFKNYLENLLLKNNIIKNKQYKQQKQGSIPPSLDNMLNIFFEYNKIILFKNIISTPLCPNILNKIKQLIDNTKLNIEHIDAHTQFYLFKLVEEIIKDQCYLYTEKAINKYLKITNNISINTINQYYDINDFNTNIKFDVEDHNLYNNYYIFKNNYIKLCDYIIYPNEYNSNVILKQTYCLKISQTLLKEILNHDVDPYIIDDYGNSIINPIEKTYHYESIMTLKNNDIDLFKYNFTKNPYDNLKSENLNHINKLINGNNYNEYISNFTSSQFDEIKIILHSNNNFGYNIINYLELSFKTCFYIMNEYLTDSLWSFTDDFLFNDMQDIFNITLNNKDNIHINYLMNIIEDIDIPFSNGYIILNDYLTKLNLELTKKRQELSKYIKLSSEYNTNNLISFVQDMNTKILNTRNDIINIQTKINNINIYTLIKPVYNNTKNFNEIIETYQIISDKGVYIKCWEELFNPNRNLLINSWNLDLIKILEKEQNIINNNLIEQNIEYEVINNFYKQLEIVGKSYFEGSNYIDDNKTKKFIFNLLVHLTSTFICYNIEMILRDLLMKYFINLNLDNDFSRINDRINYLLESSKNIINNNNFIDILYNEIPTEFVQNSCNLFKNINDKKIFESKSIKEILNDLFDILSVGEIISIPSNSKFMEILKNNLSDYFDLFIQKLINNWLVVIENIFKFSINQYRINKTILELIK